MTRSFLTLGAAALAVSAFSASQTSAATVYETDFTTADGFTEGGLLDGIDGWSAQSASTPTPSALRTVNVGTNGEVQFEANFIRGFNGATAFDVGDTITVTSSVRARSAATPGFNPTLLQLGLTNNTNLGNSEVLTGVSLGSNTDGNFTVSDRNGPRIASIGLDIAYHTLTTSITKSATANEFTVTSNFAGTPVSSVTTTNAALYNASTVYALLRSQGQSNAGGISVDTFSVDRVAVPEPTTAALLGLGGLAMLGRRRKTA